MYVCFRRVGWRTYSIVLLVFAHIGEPMASRRAQSLLSLDVLRLYRSFLYLCSRNCLLCVCLRQAGWRTYYAVPLVLCRVMLDLRRDLFVQGYSYAALSRVRHSSDIKILSTRPE